MVLLANDHAKMLRTAISDLDRIRYTRDELFVPQSIDSIVQTWRDVYYRIASGQAAQVRCHTNVSGYIADSVIELAALERVLYNIINNAVAHVYDGPIIISIDYSDGNHQFVRMSITNRISADQVTLLNQLTHNNPVQLITQPITTTGSGLGLGICADIVSHVLQIDGTQVLQQQLFTVHWSDTHFVVSFVWPMVSHTSSFQ